MTKLVGQLVIQPLDDVAARYGDTLLGMGRGKAQRVMGRALNYEGAKVFTSVRRAVREQSSIPTWVLWRAMRARKASTRLGGSLEFAIIGIGRELSLRYFGPRQFAAGTRAKVWGRFQMYDEAFMGPRPGVVSAKLGGHVFTRTTSRRFPIKRLSGPSVPREMVRDQSRAVFEASMPNIVNRIGKQIAAVLRGF